MIIQEEFNIRTHGRGTTDITEKISEFVIDHSVTEGLCNVFLQHTSASLILCENADPTVRVDLEYFMQKFILDGDPNYQHNTEGADDMAAHIRTVLTNNSLSIPISNRRLNLGTWQGIYLWEHRYNPHNRRLIVTIYR